MLTYAVDMVFCCHAMYTEKRKRLFCAFLIFYVENLRIKYFQRSRREICPKKKHGKNAKHVNYKNNTFYPYFF